MDNNGLLPNLWAPPGPFWAAADILRSRLPRFSRPLRLSTRPYTVQPALSCIIAKDGEPPEILEIKVWNEPIEGLLITAGVTLVITNLFDLSRNSIMGSAAFLLIFAAVCAANAILAKKADSRCWLPIMGVVLCLGAFGSLMWEIGHRNPSHLWILLAMLILAFHLEGAYRLVKERPLKVPLSRKAGPRR